MKTAKDRLDALGERLIKDEAAVAKHWKRLKRSVAALEKLRRRITATEKQIRQARNGETES